MISTKQKVIKISSSRMSIKDIDEVHLIEKAVFHAPWSAKMFYQGLSENEAFKAFVVRSASGQEKGKILAYAAMFDLEDEYHIINFAVHPEYRRMKIGSRMLKFIISSAERNHVERITLEVRRSNKEAISFYSAHGFTPVAVIENYYADNGEDAMVLWINRSSMP